MSLRSCGLRLWLGCERPFPSNLEHLRVTHFDLLARLLHSGGIVLPYFYIVELARARLFLDQRVRGMLAGKIDQKLLGGKRMQPALEQPGGVRIGRRSEYGARAGDERRALGRIDHLDRLPRLLELDQ